MKIEEVGYSNKHAGDNYGNNYGFFDIVTKQINASRELRWTRKFYAEGNYINIPNNHQDSKINILDTRNENEVSENTQQENENQAQQETTRLQMTYNPMKDDVSDILLVEGTDENYKAPEKFDEAWNNENPYLRDKWKEVFKKNLKI